jgi:hypothetical protein
MNIDMLPFQNGLKPFEKSTQPPLRLLAAREFDTLKEAVTLQVKPVLSWALSSLGFSPFLP